MKDEVLTNLNEEGQVAVETTAQTLEDAGFDVRTEIREGNPAEEIIAYVESQAIDLVTMGTQGDDYSENMLGSTSQKVVTNAPIPVLTVNVSVDR